MATLGISTNTRLLGLAIIHKGELVDYAMRLYKFPWSPTKADKIITSLEPCVRRYSIKTIILSTPHEIHKTAHWKYLVSLLKRRFKQASVTVKEVRTASLYIVCPPERKKTKKMIMEVLCNSFPELTHTYYKECRNKNKYYIKMFEAIAAALLYEPKE